MHDKCHVTDRMACNHMLHYAVVQFLHLHAHVWNPKHNCIQTDPVLVEDPITTQNLTRNCFRIEQVQEVFGTALSAVMAALDANEDLPIDLFQNNVRIYLAICYHALCKSHP